MVIRGHGKEGEVDRQIQSFMPLGEYISMFGFMQTFVRDHVRSSHGSGDVSGRMSLGFQIIGSLTSSHIQFGKAAACVHTIRPQVPTRVHRSRHHNDSM